MRGIVVTLPRREQLVEEHPAFFKPVYYAMFVDPVREALQAVGVTVRDAEHEERGVIARIAFPDGGRVAALIDYADNVHVDGLVAFARGTFDFVFKMKPCQRYADEYLRSAADGVLIEPWGYVIAPTYSGEPEDCRENRRWFFSNRGALTDVKDGGGGEDLPFLTRGAYHAMGACRERQLLYDQEFDQGGKETCEFKQHMQDVARAKFVLNACGPDNTIDRKVVEFCGIGAVILSNDGLQDLILPWGRRFVHGENVWFVKNPQEIRTALQTMDRDTRQRLIAGSRALWDDCFAPRSIGTWMLGRAWEHRR